MNVHEFCMQELTLKGRTDTKVSTYHQFEKQNIKHPPLHTFSTSISIWRFADTDDAWIRYKFEMIEDGAFSIRGVVFRDNP
jgi:hypothetical protein